jgi:hypothetical protein
VTYGILGVYFFNMKASKAESTDYLGFFTGEVTSWIDEVFVMPYCNKK